MALDKSFNLSKPPFPHCKIMPVLQSAAVRMKYGLRWLSKNRHAINVGLLPTSPTQYMPSPRSLEGPISRPSKVWMIKPDDLLFLYTTRVPSLKSLWNPELSFLPLFSHDSHRSLHLLVAPPIPTPDGAPASRNSPLEEVLDSDITPLWK